MEIKKCVSCGREIKEESGNESFDMEKFNKLKENAK